MPTSFGVVEPVAGCHLHVPRAAQALPVQPGRGQLQLRRRDSCPVNDRHASSLIPGPMSEGSGVSGPAGERIGLLGWLASRARKCAHGGRVN